MRSRKPERRGAGAREAPLAALPASSIDIIDHEFRTPLNIILGFAALLADGAYGPLSEQAAEVARQIEANACRLTELLEDLQLHARLMSDTGSMQIDEIDVAHLAQALQSEFSPQFAHLNQHLDIQLPEPATRIQSDPGRLYTVLRHLLANAHKFTPAGGHIVLRIDTVPEGWRFSIADTGIGIPKAARPHIFERFYQVDSGPSRTHGGIGLGLAIVKAMVDSLGGRIQLESEPGNGTRFDITLPPHPPLGRQRIK